MRRILPYRRQPVAPVGDPVVVRREPRQGGAVDLGPGHRQHAVDGEHRLGDHVVGQQLDGREPRS